MQRSTWSRAPVLTTVLRASPTGAIIEGGGEHWNNSKVIVTGDMVLCVTSRQINDPTESSSYFISPLVLSLITVVLQMLHERYITTSIYNCTLSNLLYGFLLSFGLHSFPQNRQPWLKTKSLH